MFIIMQLLTKTKQPPAKDGGFAQRKMGQTHLFQDILMKLL